MTTPPTATAPNAPTPRELRRWRRYLAEERAEAATYRALAVPTRPARSGRSCSASPRPRAGTSSTGRICSATASVVPPGSISSTLILIFLAKHFGSVFVLALAQRAEGRSPYATDEHATDAMAADETIHAEVVRALAERGRNRLSGTFRAAVFGANDGLVSNLALVLGIAASGVPNHTILLTGLAGLLAGALSMGAGEYVSVRSQRELLEASTPSQEAGAAVPALDVDANELSLIYRARGMSPAQAETRATEVLAGAALSHAPVEGVDEHEAVGNGLSAGLSSFCFFASGAIIPVLPFLFGHVGVPGDHRLGGAGRARPARHRCDRRAAVGRTAAEAGAAPAGDRVRRRRR